MKIKHKIFIFFLCFFILSANDFAMNVSSVSEKKEMKCCVEKKSCHGKSQKDKGCDDSKCPSNDCHLQTISLKIISEIILQNISYPEYSIQSSNDEFYLRLIIKDLSYTFWHPPKYIS